MKSTQRRRVFGEHLTSVDIFKKYILPSIKDKIYNYRWVDFFAGEGNLILPILDLVPTKKRVDFFKKHIFLFDVQPEMVAKMIDNTVAYGIPAHIARQNMMLRDNLKDYPDFVFNGLPIFHISNPPYLYFGYIKKHLHTKKYLPYFTGENKGYQDLYQLAMLNDLRYEIRNSIYIIPSNFIFGSSGANKIRDDFLPYYDIQKAIIFEKKIFEFTGVNVLIAFFERKNSAKKTATNFKGTKIGNTTSGDTTKTKTYCLKADNHYRAGGEFDDFVNTYKSNSPVKMKYYLSTDETDDNKGDISITLTDANNYGSSSYAKLTIAVNKEMHKRIKSNILFIRTVDTGSIDGRAGIYTIADVFGTDGILVTKSKYRTHPIQLFFDPPISTDEQILIMDYFNLMLEYFRDITDSEFITTYKYSDSTYTRKYVGLSQVRRLIETCPLGTMDNTDTMIFTGLVRNRDTVGLVDFVMNGGRELKVG